jgi:Secretion system C-terminal sorting domain
MQNSGDLSLKVTNLTGQTLMSMEKTNVHAGVNEFVIDANQLSSGIYFYTVKQGDKSITKKMIVQ